VAIAWRHGALVLALAMGGWLIITGGATTPARQPVAAAPPVAPSSPPPLATVWPAATVSTVGGGVDDGTQYTPWLYTDPDVSLDVVETPDRSATRLLLRHGADPPRELQHVPNDRYPQFLGFATSGDYAYWFETTTTPTTSEDRLWRVNWRTAAAAQSLTTDTGVAVFFESQYDLVVTGGRVYWAAQAPGEQPVTEIRSVPVTGGTATIRTVPGAYGLSAWPWLQSQGGPNDPHVLLNLDTGTRIVVPTNPTEKVTCSPVWCRSIVQSADGAITRFDLMHPDGTDRHRMLGGTGSAVNPDVGLLDRFEVFTVSRDTSIDLLLYDITHARVVTVAADVGVVIANGGMLWWSTGDQQTTQWHALALATLA
jgi:hypothetical protein